MRNNCLYFFILLVLLFQSCTTNSSERDIDLVEVSLREEITNITFTTANVKANISNPFKDVILDFGVCYSTSTSPKITDFVSEPVTGFDLFFCNLIDLQKNTKYYLRAFVVLEDERVVYSNEISFTTDDLVHACSPPTNNVWDIDYKMSIGSSGWTFGDFVFKGQGPTSDLYIEFDVEPRSGEYWTVGSDGFLDPNQCAIIISRGYLFYALQGQKINVENFGDGKFNLTFCDINFSGSNTQFTTDGNVTID